MEKINFEDATLKKSAYVTINETEYPVTDAEYVGGTDLNAATLNYAFKLMHPVGSIYMTTVATNPSEIFGFGTWELWGAGRVPVGVDTTQTEFNEVEKTGGEKKHTLTPPEMPSHKPTLVMSYTNTQTHTHAGGTYAKSFAEGANPSDGTYEANDERIKTIGDDQPHNNLQPYITCYMFKRTA